MKIALVTAGMLVAFANVAHARDHMELVCTAIGDAKDGGDKVPLFVHMFESRASDGESRDEVLSTIYQGVLFQASHTNKTGGFSNGVKISLTHGKQIRFRGKYSLDSAKDGYVLKLAGEVNDLPSEGNGTFRAVTATLKCVDLSI